MSEKPSWSGTDVTVCVVGLLANLCLLSGVESATIHPASPSSSSSSSWSEFPLSREDEERIRVSELLGLSTFNLTYPGGVSCDLAKTFGNTSSKGRNCRNVEIPQCRTVQKVVMKYVTEDCSHQSEYCQYNFRLQELSTQTIICSKSTELDCDDTCTTDCPPVVCETNPLVSCNTVPQKVAVTEKRQRCAPDNELQTTKICFTYPDASWVCREPKLTRDCDRDSVKLIAHEISMPRIECRESEGKPICFPKNCRLKSNNTDCLTSDLPTQIELEDQLCEACEQGRTKLRPVLVQEEECKPEGTVQQICSGQEPSGSGVWRKTCFIPNALSMTEAQDILATKTAESGWLASPDGGEGPPNDRVTGANYFLANKYFRKTFSNTQRVGYAGQETDGDTVEVETGDLPQIVRQNPAINDRIIDDRIAIPFIIPVDNDKDKDRSTTTINLDGSNEVIRFSVRPTPLPLTTPQLTTPSSKSSPSTTPWSVFTTSTTTPSSTGTPPTKSTTDRTTYSDILTTLKTTPASTSEQYTTTVTGGAKVGLTSSTKKSFTDDNLSQTTEDSIGENGSGFNSLAIINIDGDKTLAADADNKDSSVDGDIIGNSIKIENKNPTKFPDGYCGPGTTKKEIWRCKVINCFKNSSYCWV